MTCIWCAQKTLELVNSMRAIPYRGAHEGAAYIAQWLLKRACCIGYSSAQCHGPPGNQSTARWIQRLLSEPPHLRVIRLRTVLSTLIKQCYAHSLFTKCEYICGSRRPTVWCIALLHDGIIHCRSIFRCIYYLLFSYTRYSTVTETRSALSEPPQARVLPASCMDMPELIEDAAEVVCILDVAVRGCSF
jgi:hypothetical protein